MDVICSRTLTCITHANLKNLVDIAVAKILIVDKWSKEIAAWRRMRVFAFRLVHKTLSIPKEKKNSCQAYSSAMLGTKEPSCSTNVASILSAGVAISAALSDSAWARQRFRQTFRARIFALRLSGSSSFSIQSPAPSSSSSSPSFSLRYQSDQ